MNVKNLISLPPKQNIYVWEHLKILFKGRIGRKHHFLLLLLLLLATIPFAFVLVFVIDLLPGLLKVVPVIIFLTFFAMYGLSLTVRRMHDIGISALWLIPYYAASLILGLVSAFLGDTALYIIDNAVAILSSAILFLYPGAKGSNRFGLPTFHHSLFDVMFNRESKQNTEMVDSSKGKWRLSSKYKMHFSAFSLLIISSLLLLHAKFLDNLPSVSYEEDPASFSFVYFPLTPDKTVVYSDQELKEAIGFLNNAVEVNGDEINVGLVEVNFKRNNECIIAYVNFEELTLTPPANSKELITKTDEIYQTCGDSSHIVWSQQEEADSNVNIEYETFTTTLTKYDSSTKYSYATQGEKIITVNPSQSKGFIRVQTLIIFSVPFLIFLLLLIYLVSKVIFKPTSASNLEKPNRRNFILKSIITVMVIISVIYLGLITLV